MSNEKGLYALIVFGMLQRKMEKNNWVLVWTARLVRKGYINRHWMGSLPERTFLKLHYKYFLDNMPNEKGSYKQVVFGIQLLVRITLKNIWRFLGEHVKRERCNFGTLGPPLGPFCAPFGHFWGSFGRSLSTLWTFKN